MLILYSCTFFQQPSTLALALLSCELVYVSDSWLQATHFLQHEAKVNVQFDDCKSEWDERMLQNTMLLLVN